MLVASACDICALVGNDIVSGVPLAFSIACVCTCSVPRTLTAALFLRLFALVPRAPLPVPAKDDKVVCTDVAAKDEVVTVAGTRVAFGPRLWADVKTSRVPMAGVAASCSIR